VGPPPPEPGSEEWEFVDQKIEEVSNYSRAIDGLLLIHIIDCLLLIHIMDCLLLIHIIDCLLLIHIMFMGKSE